MYNMSTKDHLIRLAILILAMLSGCGVCLVLIWRLL